MAIAAVRAAVPADVDEIVRIQDVTWRAAYAGAVPEEALAALTGPQARQAWIDAVGAGGTTTDAATYHVHVATEGDWTVGFCAAANYRGEGGALAEISTLLVEPRWGRRGHGGRLLAHTSAALRAAGADRGHAWLLASDAASLRFYGLAGWGPDGAARALDTGDEPLREIRVSGLLELHLAE